MCSCNSSAICRDAINGVSTMLIFNYYNPMYMIRHNFLSCRDAINGVSTDLISLTLSTTPGRTSSTLYISSLLVNLPGLNLRDETACSFDKPIARRTWEGSTFPSEQAEPVDTAIPSISRFITSDSPSTPSKLKFNVFESLFSG